MGLMYISAIVFFVAGIGCKVARHILEKKLSEMN